MFVRSSIVKSSLIDYYIQMYLYAIGAAVILNGCGQPTTNEINHKLLATTTKKPIVTTELLRSISSTGSYPFLNQSNTSVNGTVAPQASSHATTV